MADVQVESVTIPVPSAKANFAIISESPVTDPASGIKASSVKTTP